MGEHRSGPTTGNGHRTPLMTARTALIAPTTPNTTASTTTAVQHTVVDVRLFQHELEWSPS